MAKQNQISLWRERLKERMYRNGRRGEAMIMCMEAPKAMGGDDRLTDVGSIPIVRTKA